MQCLKQSGLLEKNISKDTLYVPGKDREVESCDSNKILIKDKAYEHLSTICRREREKYREREREREQPAALGFTLLDTEVKWLLFVNDLVLLSQKRRYNNIYTTPSICHFS